LNDDIKGRQTCTFTPTEWEKLYKTRQKYKHNRLLANFKLVLFKEMPSIIHSRASRYLEEKMALAITECCLLPDGNDDYDRVTMQRDGSMHLFCVDKANLIVLHFPCFSGEPDWSLTWPGSTNPFIIIETGVSDTIEKTRSRARHWITKSAGSVSLVVNVSEYSRSNLL